MPFVRKIGSVATGGGSGSGSYSGIWNRNCVLSGKYLDPYTQPAYVKVPVLLVPNSPYEFYAGYLTASEGTANNALPVSNALDSDTSYWHAENIGCWLQYNHQYRPFKARKYKFITENGYTPQIWHLQGSNDGTNWTTLHENLVTYTWEDGKNIYEADIPTENQGVYTYHRILIDEFDATQVRIYSIQLWDADFTYDDSIMIDASAEWPLQLSFADGFNPDGTPIDIIKVLTTRQEIRIGDLAFTAPSLLDGNNDCANGILFAVYDSQTDTVSFQVDNVFNISSPLNNDTVTFENGSTSWDNPQNLFDGNDGTYTGLHDRYDRYAYIVPTTPFYSDSMFIKLYSNDTYYQEIAISEDYGSTFEQVLYDTTSGTQSFYVVFPKVYYVTKIRYKARNYTSYSRIYTLALNDASRCKDRKYEDGKVWEYIPATETWEQVYKIPLGYVHIWKNLDGTAYVPYGFTPTFSPMSTIAPNFKKIATPYWQAL